MDYWQKQTADKPLYEDILWARPESRHGAGKLLIAGGSAHGFAATGEAYTAAETAGAGHIRALLPDAIRTHSSIFWGQNLDIEFAASTHSGSFGQDALNELLIGANWADAVLLAGDLGRNSETAILLEKFLGKYSGPLTLTKDAVDYFNHQPKLIINRTDTCVVLSLAQLQKLGLALKYETPFLLSMGLMLLVQALHDFTQKYPAVIVVKELDNIVVAHKGRVSSTKLEEDKNPPYGGWRVETAAKATVFWLQNKNRPFEAITSSLAVKS